LHVLHFSLLRAAGLLAGIDRGHVALLVPAAAAGQCALVVWALTPTCLLAIFHDPPTGKEEDWDALQLKAAPFVQDLRTILGGAA
jgi:hypothetical protein